MESQKRKTTSKRTMGNIMGNIMVMKTNLSSQCSANLRQRFSCAKPSYKFGRWHVPRPPAPVSNLHGAVQVGLRPVEPIPEIQPLCPSINPVLCPDTDKIKFEPQFILISSKRRNCLTLKDNGPHSTAGLGESSVGELLLVLIIFQLLSAEPINLHYRHQWLGSQ